MIDPDPLYEVEAYLCNEDLVERYGATHAFVELSPVRHRLVEGYTRTQLLDAWRWAAGVMGRVAVTLAREINGDDFLDPYAEDPLTRDVNDRAFVEGTGIIDLTVHRFNENDVVSVGIWVPGRPGRAKEWFARAQQLLGEVIAADSQPVPPERGQHHVDAHRGVVLHEPSRTNQEERTTGDQ
jgi:hypothetical protein